MSPRSHQYIKSIRQMTEIHYAHKYLRFAIALMATVAVASCTDEDSLSESIAGSKEIKFEIAAQATGRSMDNAVSATTPRTVSQPLTLASQTATSLYLIPTVTATPAVSSATNSRSTLTDNTNISSAGVYATLNGQPDAPYYMCNVAITAANAWTPVEKYLWPGAGTLHITAFSPYQAEANSEAEAGIVSLPSISDPSSHSIDYITPTSADAQTDILWATPVDASSSPCTLTMNHALTAVRFVTGDEMAPYTVTSISLGGVLSRGTLDISSGEWSNVTDAKSYTIAPSTRLTAAEGSEYVAPETPLAPADSTLLFIPQTLGDDATATLTVDIDGQSTTFTASLKGQVWTAGTTVTYHLSATPTLSDLILQITDSEGNPVTSLTTPYTGGSDYFTVKSYLNSGDTQTPVEWKAEYLDADGNLLTATPVWIKGIPTEGSGTDSYTLTTDLFDPVFLSMSDNTRILRSTADINTTSSHNPYNLSSSTGASTIENTANSYIINAPGSYSLPLVYGNAIKNSAANESSYISTLSATTAHKNKALLHFINHLGNEITSPYIWLNKDCTPAGARLIWEDQINLVRNIRLSSDGHALLFDVPEGSIRQGNAMIAVTDADDNVMWSWQIWVTDYRPEESYASVVCSDNSTGYLYTRNLGRIYGGDRLQFTPEEVTLRITQVNTPEGITPLTTTLLISQKGTELDIEDCQTFYQWGRKDPMITGSSRYYDTSHRELSTATIPTISFPTTDHNVVTNSILHPGYFIEGTESQARSLRPFYSNLWSINVIPASTGLQPDNVKTIYDPCPVGSKVPNGNTYDALINMPHSYDAAKGQMVFTLTDGSTISFDIIGYRSPGDGIEKSQDGTGNTWCTIAGSGSLAQYLNVSKDGTVRRTGNNIFYGFGMRPALDR